MIAYVGQTRSKSLIAELLAHGLRECTQRGELPPRRSPWFFDNGAFRDWKAGAPFAVGDYVGSLRLLRTMETPPDFIVAPDIVAGGAASIRRSIAWIDGIKQCSDAPIYLVAQDGMTDAEILTALEWFGGLFVGGSVGWKRDSAERLVQLAHDAHKPCHIGRAGTARKVAWCIRIGADSLDSCLPLWSKQYLAKFLDALAGRQLDMWG